MNSIKDLTLLHFSTLSASSPDIGDYDSVSEGWSEQEYRVDFGNQDVEGGYWAGLPGSVSFDEWPYTELCVILAGRISVEAEDGTSQEYQAGESFLIPQGFKGTWHTLEPTEKIFVGVQKALEAKHQ